MQARHVASPAVSRVHCVPCLRRAAQRVKPRGRAARVCRAEHGESTPASKQQQVPPWLQDLEQELGVRVIHEAEAPKPIEELEDEEEDWDEVMAALENPWVMEEGDDDDEGEDLEGFANTPPASSDARTAGEASSSTATGSQPQQSPPGFEHILGAEQLDRLRSAVPGLIVLDVGDLLGSSRAAAPESAQGQSLEVGEGLGGKIDAPESTQGQYVHVPIEELTGSRARDLASAPAVVVVNGPDHKGLQACLRLSRVYHAQSVFLWSPE